MRILVVDDEPYALQVMSRAIRMCEPDCELIVSDNSEEVLSDALAGKISPEIAFLDIEMPAPDGVTLARELKKINPHINIIFATGYARYMKEALNMFVSGYLLKPVEVEDVRLQLENLRYPVKAVFNGFHAQAFGEFDFFKDGEPVAFETKKAKELLACLITQHGSSLTKKEICGELFGDKYDATTQDYFKKIVRSLKNSLAAAGGGDILIQNRNSYAVNLKMFTCDYYDYLDGKAYAINAYQGYFMKQYSWAEGIM